MDRIRAERLARELAGHRVGGWEVGELAGNGASAAVFKAFKGDQIVALKIIDPELEDRFGAVQQEQRVLLEKELIGKEHPNLVKIYDGGRCTDTQHLYIAMEYLPGDTLTKKIANFPPDKARKIISQLASAAKFLEEHGYSHRDIKPDNIAISSDCEHAKLLDLGILRPVSGTGNGTGDEFIGTTRYSSPEFIMREEKDTEDGWRAVTFYQLGAVLHDMLMRRRIFDHVNAPWAKVLDAVRTITPIIDAPDALPGLVTLARSCLNKEPDARLALVCWDDFFMEPKSINDLAKYKEDIRRRQTTANKGVQPHIPSSIPNDRMLDQTVHKIDAIVREICQQSETFPPLEINHRNGTTDEKILEVKTGPSSPYGLANVLIVQLKLVLVDVTGPAITLSAVASIVTPVPASSLEHWITIFRGVADSSEMRTSLDWFMHRALYAGLNAGPSTAGHILTIER
jgi:serine/threonine protein kinase